jgi:uncharacterized protein YcbX
MRLICFCCLCCLFYSSVVVEATAASSTTSTRTTITEPRTNILFETKIHNNLSLQKLGVRSKGPFKVYAVGYYSKGSAASNNNNINNVLFVLKMNMSINSEKMSSALLDALKPRCSSKFKCTTDEIQQFKDMILQSLPSGAKSGYALSFHITNGGNKITLSVNNKEKGHVISRPVAQAFIAIYTDSNAVCDMRPVDLTSSTTSNNTQDDIIMNGIMRNTVLFLVFTTTIIIVINVSNKNDTTNATVCELNIYPVKSCAEQTLDSAIVTRRGFIGDRIMMVVDDKSVCCTCREREKVSLFHVQPHISLPHCDTISFTFKNQPSSFLEVTDLRQLPQTNKIVSCQHNEAPAKLLLADLGHPVASWFEKHTGIPGCRLMSIHDDPSDTDRYHRSCLVNPDQGDAVPPTVDPAPVSLADEAPFLLMNQSSLNDLNRRMEQRGLLPVDMRRFRPNIVVSGADLLPWIEDTWKKIRIGDHVEFFVWQRCGRCIMTTIDRDTLEYTSKAEPLPTLGNFREDGRNFGVHLIPDPATLREGDAEIISANQTIRLGDTIQVLEYDTKRRKH